MSTSQLSNQLAKEATLQNIVGNTTMTLIGITREDWILKRIGKTRIIKEAIYSEEKKNHINGISFKLPTIWKPILWVKQRNEKQALKFDCENTSPSRYVRNANQPINNDHRSLRSPCKHINTKNFTLHKSLSHNCVPKICLKNKYRQNPIYQNRSQKQPKNV